MPSRRHLDAEHPAYDPGACGADGHAQCRRCLGNLPHTHAMFCSRRCEHEFRIRISPAYARKTVYRRDHGVCTHCRLDCGLLDRVIVRLRQVVRDPQENTYDRYGGHTEAQVNEEGEKTALWLIEQLGLGRRKRLVSLWQADHRMPFSDGGADCGLGNLRTLCLECHRQQTRELHRRMKVRRQAQGATTSK